MPDKITIWMDGKIPVRVDTEEFDIIMMMVRDAGGDKDLSKVANVVKDLVGQEYEKTRAITLCILARQELQSPH